MATWGPEPRGQAVRPSATNAAFRDAAASWFEAGLCMGRVFRTWGAGRAAPLPVAAVASASAPLGLGRPPPTSGTHHLPLEGRRERGWGAGAGGCAAPSPGHPSPRAPCGRGPSARQGGLRAAGLPAEPQRLRGKDFRDGCLSTTPPFWGESLRDAYWEPPGRPGRKGYGHQPHPGGCLAHGARAGPTAGAGAPGTQSWSRRMGRTKSPR